MYEIAEFKLMDTPVSDEWDLVGPKEWPVIG